MNSCDVENLHYDVKTLINLFFKDPYHARKELKPSVYLEEMSLSFEERINSLSTIQHRKVNFPGYIPSKYFTIIPPFILIQSFSCDKPHVVMLELKCIAKAMKSLTLKTDKNPVFTVECTSRLMSRIAPGMSVKYKVTFFPSKEVDYYHEIKFETEDESFRVPILALKSRPLLDFPDHIDIPPTPVKTTGKKTFILRNIGKAEAVFCLECFNGLFMVEPDKVRLQPGNLMTITLKMFSSVIGVFTSSMKVILETGEELSISLEASTVNSNIFIDEKRVVLPEVFMTLRERRTIKLVNNSDNLVHFSWQKYASLQEDLRELERLKHQMKGVQELESARYNLLEYHEIINAELHSSIYKRIYSDEIMLLGSDNLNFQHENFKIVPLTGEVWPGSSTEIMIIFQANKPLSAKCHAYCECTGIQERLELIVEGKSIGPDLKINLSVLNISKVPLSAEKTFEILAKNYGDIPGNLEYLENSKVSKAKISCTPRKLFLLPGETKAFFINLCSISRGEFMEELKFEIMESKEEIDFVVLGEVLLPNIYFDRNEINFGNVPLGFPLIETVHLKNNSLVAIPFSMSVPQDGFEPALTCKSVSQSKRKCGLPQNPKEFAIEPSSGEIGAGETKTIEITFTPNKYRVLSASLVLELHVNSEAETSSVKLSANAISPMIIVVPENITNPFCFINYEYRQKLTVRNITSAPGYFNILPQEINPSTGLVYSISDEEVMIAGLQMMDIEITWNVTQVGKHVETVKMLLFGEVQPEVMCELHCSGQGPLVTLIPNELHFGRVQLLTYQTLTVELINDSPIDAYFAAVNNADENFFVEIDPESGILEMNSKMRLTVGIRLYDPGNVTQKILINVKNGRQVVLTINAKGYGTSIVITPSIWPVYNLGKLASNKHYTIPLRTTNHSTKLHTIYWSKDMKGKIKPRHEDEEWKNFKFDPCKIDISPQKSAIVNLHVFSESDGERSEQFYLFAAIENKGARFLLNKVLVKVDFIHRGLELSKSSLHFRIDITPDRQTLMNQTQTIIVNNKTDLTIVSNFQLKRPFLILDHQQCGSEDRIIHFEKNSSQPIEICFSPATGLNSISTVFKGTLRVSYRDIEELIILSGEINYPNIELSEREINFGTVQPFSSRSYDIMLINDGVLPAFYFWEVTVKSGTIMPCLIDGELLRGTSVMDCKPSFCSFSNDCGNELNALNINPSFGQIEGHKNLRTTFTFSPCYMKSYVIEASCCVIGGRSKTLTIFGGSAHVQYSLEPRHVDFGFRSFNEMHRENITITNLCEMELHVTANKNLVENSEGLLNSGLFVVSPTFQKIAGLSSATIHVTYYPKICQELRDEFIIQVNSANPIPVEVRGYGTLPQVIISNPCKRTIDHEISIATFYPAISWLTSPMFASLWNQTSRDGSELQESNNFKDFADDWVLITHEDDYPPVEDIELALERILTYIHLSENGLLDSKTSVISRQRPYLELSTLNPEYVIDFGKVVVDSVVDENIFIKSANMLQSNPQVFVILPFSARALKDKYNVVLTFIKNSKSNAGVDILNVKLKPDRMTYSSKVTTLNLNVFVVVKGGLKIPLRISAVITIPFLTAITKNINFLEILVGEEKILSLLIKNEGFIPCEWTASLKFMHRPSAKSNPFSLKSSHSGYLEPSEEHIVDVSFRPEFKGKYDYPLIFEVKQNSEPIKINLQGFAIEPNLHISSNYLEFPTVCPNVEDNSKIFIVENRSSFPVEVYFPDYDRFCRREEAAVRLLCTIYSTDHLRLLPDHFGTSFNTKLLKSLHNFLVKIKMFLSTILEDRIAKSQTQNVSNEKNNSIMREEPVQLTDEIVETTEKSIEEKLFEELEKITEQDSRQSDIETHDLESFLKDFISLNAETFHELLAEHDPLQIYVQDRIDMKSSNENLKSCPCLIIFHGAPKTDFQYWANKTARLLKKPAKNLDRLIVDALISGLTSEARAVKLTIEENYSNQFESQTSELATEHMPFSLDLDSDPYYELIRKIDALIWLKNRISNSQSEKRAKSRSPATSPASTPKNKSRQKTASKFSTDWGDTLLNINLSLLREIVFQSINEEENGLVIETLSNKFIGDPIKVLILLLSCQDVNERLHFVSLFTDYKTWKSKTRATSKEPALNSDSSTKPETPQLSKPKTPSSVRKETKKTSSAKSVKKQKLHSDNKDSTEEGLLENSFENYGVELSSFMFLLGSWTPMAHPQDAFEKKLNNILSAVRKVFPSRDGKKSQSQKQIKSSSKEQGKFNFSTGFSSTSETSPGVNISIIDSKKNNINNVQNFIRELILLKKNIDTGKRCEQEDPFCKKAINYLIMKKPDVRQIHDHSDKGFSLISERHSLSNNDELSVSPSISESFNNVEEIASKKLKGFESKLKKSKRKSVAGKKKGRKSDPLSKSNDLNDSLTFSAPANVFSQIVQKESTLVPRVLLEPGATHSWQMVFEPQNVGSYKDTFDLQVARGRKLYQIKCSGKCDFPSVNFDPARVFFEVADSYVKAKNKNMIYLRDIETFSFGPLFVKPGNNSDDKESNKTATTFKFVNDSELDVEMNLSYDEESDEVLQTFSFEPKSLSISKSSRKTVSVWAHPTVPGEHEMTLICSIKDNPQSHSIKISCIGVIPEVQFLPPVLAPSHVLIGRTSTHNLLISNKCDLPILYEVTDAGSLIQGLFIKPENGVVKEQAEELVSFEYTSTKVEVIKAYKVEFKFFEDGPTKDFLFSKSITFNVECYEVLVDVIFPKKGSAAKEKKSSSAKEEHSAKEKQRKAPISSVDFGVMKIDEKIDRAFSLKNKGKFGIGFETDLVKVPGLNIHPREFLSIEPKSGTILPGKMFNLKVICSCSSTVSIVDLPVLRVRIMELHSNDSEACVISIPVTVKSFYSSFRISPNVAINFGPMLSDSEREMQLEIENTGLFDFNYALFNPQLADAMIRDFFESQKKSTPKSKKASSKKSSPAAKTRNKPENLEIEPFIIKDSCGTIKPGSIAHLKVICKNPRLGDCFKDVIIKISGSNCPEGVTYKLLTYGCSPQVDISNLDAIFQEAHLLDEFNPNSFETTLQPKTTFSKRDSTLVFYNTLVGCTANVNLHFSNTDRLPSDLSFEVTSLTDVTNACFKVHPMKETIGPLSTKLFTVSFKPRKFEIVTGEAVITTSKEVLKIKLIGEGVLPQLEIVKPLNASKSHVIMSFEPTLLSYSTVKCFTLRNAGKIRCKVVIEELDSECKVFYWRMLPETHGPKEGMKGVFDKIEADFKSIIILDPLEERDFEVEFLPDTIASFTCTLKLLLVNNPYESFSITMIGSGYQDDVVIRDLTRLISKDMGRDLLTSLKIVEETDSKFLAAYSADYGAAYIGQCREKCFQICNLSNEFYRFEWADHDNMTFSPKTGFVYPNCCEEICMAFYSEEPITPFFKIPVMCSFTQVECNDNGVLKELSSELNSLSRDCDNEVVLEPIGTGPELEFTTIEGTSQQIAIIASGVVDSPVPYCEINSLTFPETLLFQISEKSFDVTNNSYVPLIFEWRFKDASSSSFDERSSDSSSLATRVSFGTVQPRFNKLFSEATGPSICRRKINVKPSTAHNSYCAARPLPSSVSLMKRPSTAMHLKEVNDVSFVRSHYPKQSFSLSSMSGIIEAKETVSFQLSFAPVVCGIHSSLLHLRVKGLTDGCEPLHIALHGTAVSPVCHLLVTTSDCLETGRHRSGLTLEPHCKAIEFEALGSTNPITKSFDMVNTTGNPYKFILKQLGPPSSPFSCLTSGGQIEPFKQVTLSFVLFPQESDTYESLWHLEIPDLDVTQPLLIIGKAREPSVSLSSSHVYMQQNFVGVPVSNTVSLLNNENVDLKFKIFGPKDTVRPKQLGDGDKHLKIKPSSGIIKANSQIELICTILPDKPGEDVVLLKCQVEKCREPLVLHIHTSAFNVHPRISYVTHQNTVEELSPYTLNYINMNKLTPRIPSCIQFAIANVGQLPITYGCGFNSEECRLARTEIYWSKKHGTVAYRDEHKIELNVIALSKISFKDLSAVIQVNKGPMYRILLSGSAESAIYEFSFKEYNFGHCLIAEDGTLNDHTANLLVTNKDEDRIIIEVVSPAFDHFKVFVPNDGVLKPRETIAIRLSFTPVEPKLYSETVEFLINGVDRLKIVLSGEGHYLQISLADPHQKCVDFGSVLIGREVRKALTLVNNSKVSGEISLITSEAVEPPFSFEPSTKQTIAPLARKDFVLNFSPNEIIPAFSVQLLLSFGGKSEPICLVKGKAMGAKISSDRDFVTFGCVVLGCAASMKLVVYNEGDIGSHFNWEHTMPKSWFKITPSSGFLPGKSSNTLLMTFSPEEVIGFMQKQVTCYFDSKYEIKPLIITITGSCVSVPPPTDTLNFKTSVRSLQTKSIDLRNPSEDVWTISPLFSGEFFRGSKQIIIDPYDVKSYDIIYEPLTMTTDEKKHEGTVFLPFLDGSCKLFKLIGMAGIPEPESSFEWSIPCKTNCIKSLDLKNWLPFPQRFKKDMKLVKSSIPEPICTIESNLYTEVGSLQKRPYTLKIFCYQECSVQYEFVFHNETSSEYMWYSVSITFEPCPILEIFTLKTKVRQDVYLEISLVKELPCSASFCLNEVIDCIHIEPSSFNAGDEAKIAVRYFPLFVEDKRNCRLEIVSRELGKFVYSLTLSAIEPILEEAISVSTEIGSSTKFSLTVMNNCNESCTFSYKNSHPYFKCEKHVVAKAGQKVDLEIDFEPTSIGKIMAQLEVSSEEAGIFRFPVTAYCTKPTPKGPLYISSNKNTLVKVKNVFGSRQAFTWTIDNENFIVRTSKQNVKPSEHLELAIGLKIQSESTVKNIHPQIPITGKLVISCEELNIDWIFYLRNDNGE